MRTMTRLVLLITISAATAITTASQPNTQSTSLDSQIRAEVANFKGKVYLFARNLDTGETYSYNGDERVRTASTIKIAIMIEAWARVAEGKAKWTDELVLTKAARYSGSGILPEMSDGLRLSLQDCVRLMMLLSDNTATNMVKIAIMIEAWARVAEGKAKWTDELVLTKAARYSGSGILPEMSDGLRLSQDQ